MRMRLLRLQPKASSYPQIREVEQQFGRELLFLLLLAYKNFCGYTDRPAPLGQRESKHLFVNSFFQVG